jgi:hypothetical protein
MKSEPEPEKNAYFIETNISSYAHVFVPLAAFKKIFKILF